MVEAYKKFWANYTNAKDRTTRKDFWLTFLMYLIIAFCIGFVVGLVGGASGVVNDSNSFGSGALVGFIWGLAHSIGFIFQSIRRLHDVNKSGWWYLISFVPLIGSIWLFVLFCSPSVTEGNNYGVQL